MALALAEAFTLIFFKIILKIFASLRDDDAFIKLYRYMITHFYWSHWLGTTFSISVVIIVIQENGGNWFRINQGDLLSSFQRKVRFRVRIRKEKPLDTFEYFPHFVLILIVVHVSVCMQKRWHYLLKNSVLRWREECTDGTGYYY